MEQLREKKVQGNKEKVIQEEIEEEEVEKEVNHQFKNDDEGTSKKREEVNALKFPLPQVGNRKQFDKQLGRFIELMKYLHINILFTEALKQMPIYAKFMKE